MNHPKQHTLWLLAALSAPIAHFSGVGWLTGAITALVILPMLMIPRNWELSKTIAILEILWLGIVAGILLPGSASYWPSDNTFVVPLSILTLAALTNNGSAPRIGAVLALSMTLLAIPVGISAASRIEPSWLMPVLKPWSSGLALALLLPMLPAAGKEQQGRRAAGALALTILLCSLVQGVIGDVNVPDPFYQTARTLGHMEPVVAAGVSLGWYALTCLLLQSASHIAASSGIGRKWASVLVVGTTTVLILFPQQPNGRFVTVISLFLWLIAPFVSKIKDFEKSEK